jgi:hypothetical protein
MSSKYAIVVLVIMTAILLTGSGRNTAQADTDLVTDIQFSPDPPIAGEVIEFSCKLTDEMDVDNVVLSMCSDIYCFPPNIMEKGTDEMYRTTSTDASEVGEYHFNITIHYANGTRAWTDDIYFDAVTTDLGTLKLEHIPGKVIIGKEVDVYTVLDNETGVSDVSLLHCQGDVCFNPVPMTLLDNGSYHARIGPFDTADEIKYNVTATYEDGHRAWTEDIKFTPEKKTSDDDDNGGIIPALGVVAVIAVLTGLAMTRRDRKRGT